MYPDAIWALPGSFKNIALFYNKALISNPRTRERTYPHREAVHQPNFGQFGKWGFVYSTAIFIIIRCGGRASAVRSSARSARPPRVRLSSCPCCIAADDRRRQVRLRQGHQPERLPDRAQRHSCDAVVKHRERYVSSCPVNGSAPRSIPASTTASRNCPSSTNAATVPFRSSPPRVIL